MRQAIDEYLKRITIIENNNEFIYHDHNEIIIHDMSVYCLQVIREWMQEKKTKFSIEEVKYGTKPCNITGQMPQDWNEVTMGNYELMNDIMFYDTNNITNLKNYLYSRISFSTYDQGSYIIRTNINGDVYNSLRNLVIAHKYDHTKPKPKGEYEEYGYIKYLKIISFGDENSQDAESRVKRLSRGGIDNILVYYQEEETEKYYTPPNKGCFKNCINKIIPNSEYIIRDKLNLCNLHKDVSLYDNLKQKCIDKNCNNNLKLLNNYLSNITNNNTVSSLKTTPYQFYGECLDACIKTKFYCETTKEWEAINYYNKKGKTVIKLYEYEIIFSNPEEVNTLNPYLSDIQNKEILKGKHVSLCKASKYFKGIFTPPKAKILTFTSIELKENIVNQAIKSSLRSLSDKKEYDEEDVEQSEEPTQIVNPMTNNNVFFLDIETKTSNIFSQSEIATPNDQKILNAEGYVSNEQMIYTNVSTECFKKVEASNQTYTDSIQVCSYRKVFEEYSKLPAKPSEISARLFRKKTTNVFQNNLQEPSENIWIKFFEYLAMGAETNYLKDNIKIKYVEVYTYNGSNFDIYKLLTDVSGISSIRISSILNNSQGIIRAKAIFEMNNIKLYVIFKDLIKIMPVGKSLVAQCKIFNIPPEFKKIDLKSFTRKTIEQLIEDNTKGTITPDNKSILDEYLELNDPDKASIFEDVTSLDIVKLQRLKANNQLTREQQDILEMYDRNDVLCLAFIFKQLNSNIQKFFDIDSKKCLTASSLAFAYARKHICPQYRYISNPEINFKIIDKSIYGGICLALRDKFASKNPDPEVSYKNDDYMRACDANSLYPSTMCMPDFNYASESNPPIFYNHESQLYLDNVKDMLNQHTYNKSGYICADIECDNKVIIPVLAEKINSETSYNNYDKKCQVYNVITVQDSIKYTNAKITKIYFILEYPETRALLREAISFLVVNRTKYKIGAKADTWTDTEYLNYKSKIEDESRKLFLKDVKCEYLINEYIIKGVRDEYLKHLNFDDDSGDYLSKKEFSQYCQSTQELFKLLGNSVYGKTLEKPYYINKKMIKCQGTHCLVNKCLCSGVHYKNNGRSLQECVTDASINYSRDLGSTVLALSKRNMYNVINIINGFYKPVIYYIDTDSMYMEEKNCKLVKQYDDPDLPFCFKFNEIEFVKNCPSIVTEAHFYRPKVKGLFGYYLTDNKWNCSNKISIKGYKTFKKDLYVTLKRDNPHLTIMQAFAEQDRYNVCYNDIKLLSEDNKSLVKTQLIWRKNLLNGIRIDVPENKTIDPIKQIDRLMKAVNGVRYPLGFKV